MPSAHPSANPFRNPRLSDVAREGKLLTMRCGLCRRSVHFWAADLVAVIGGDHQAHIRPVHRRALSWAGFLSEMEEKSRGWEVFSPADIFLHSSQEKAQLGATFLDQAQRL